MEYCAMVGALPQNCSHEIFKAPIPAHPEIVVKPIAGNIKLSTQL